MKIAVTEKNRSAIETALNTVNGRSSSHCYTTYAEIEYIAKRAEKRCESLLSAKKDFAGASFSSESGDSMPNSYKGMRNSTTIIITRGSKYWFLTTVNSSTLYPNQAGKEVLHFTTEQEAKAVAILKAQFTVK